MQVNNIQYMNLERFEQHRVLAHTIHFKIHDHPSGQFTVNNLFQYTQCHTYFSYKFI